MSENILTHRQQFPYVDRYTYFNHGGQGLMPQRAMTTLTQAQEWLQSNAPFCSGAHGWMEKAIQELRSAIGQELNAPAATIALTEATTWGCNIALWGIDWQPGDRILITDCEHQGIIATIQELQHRFQIEMDVCPIMTTLNQGDPVEVIRSAIQPRTRMLVLSHVLWNTGQVLPLPEIVDLCHSQDVLVMVDAAQSVGMLPLDLTALGADFYAFTGHKWWGGPQGVGGLYVRPASRDRLRPTFIGWRSVDIDAKSKPTQFKNTGERYEIATSNIPNYMALTETLRVHQAFGTTNERYELIRSQAAHLWQRLNQIPQVQCLSATAPESGLISFQLNSGRHAELVKTLEAQQIYLRLILDPNCVRACVHYFTTDAEIDKLVEAIKQDLVI
jgi:L-cysteine/cystine lyase